MIAVLARKTTALFPYLHTEYIFFLRISCGEYSIKNYKKILKNQFILFSQENKRKFKISPEVLELANVQDVTNRTIPEDYKDTKVHMCFKITHKTPTAKK